MLKGFRFPSKNGNSISIVEVEGFEEVSIVVHGANGETTVNLDREDWLALCELKYKIDVNKPEEIQTSPKGERVAGEDF